MTSSRRFSRIIALSLAFTLLAALVVIAEIAQNGQKQIDGRIGASQRRQILLVELLEQVSQAEAGQRGYLLTGDAQYLRPYQSARERIEPTLARLDALLPAGPGAGVADGEWRDAIGSHGLATMRHRVRSFDGRLEIATPADGGTRLQAHLPLGRILRRAPAAAAPGPLERQRGG